MQLLPITFYAAALSFLVACGSANAPQAGVQAADAWLRASVPGSSMSAGYLTLHNGGPQADAVVGVEIDGVRKGEIHSMEHVDGMMRMRPMESLELPVDEPVKLAPGGNHLMLMGVEQTLELGTVRQGKLILRSGKELPVDFAVRNQTKQHHE